MTRWGVGPRWTALSVALTIPALAASVMWPELARFPAAIPRALVVGVGWVLVAIGLPQEAVEAARRLAPRKVAALVSSAVVRMPRLPPCPVVGVALLAAVALACARRDASRPSPAAKAPAANAPAGPFVSLADVDPSIRVEARYAGSHNFVGRPIAGYRAPRCLLAPRAAAALAAVQADLRRGGLGLKAYDCYRPRRAVDDFARWADDPADQAMKPEFYPRVDKRDLFRLGYIAHRSGHSRGSTVDVTLVPLAPQPQPPPWVPGTPLVDCAAPAGVRYADGSLDMGTGYDCLDPAAHIDSPAIGEPARSNRARLRAAMEAHGFKVYPAEWWHFTLVDEPFPDTFFDTEVE